MTKIRHFSLLILTFAGYYLAAMPEITTDIKENDILRRWLEVLQTLLIDHTTHRNIIWATDMYVSKFGEDYSFSNEIKIEQLYKLFKISVPEQRHIKEVLARKEE